MGRHWRDRRLSVAPPLRLGSSPCISPSLLLQETHHLGPPPGYPWPRSFCSAQRPLKLLIFPGTSRPVPLRPRLQSLQPWFISGPSQGSRSPSISPLPRPSGPRPYGHTLNSAIVRLRLYRFSERKLLRELLMKTVTVGADNPVTSISPRPAGSRSRVCCLTPALLPHTRSAAAAAASGKSVPPPAPDLANPRSRARKARQSPLSPHHLAALSYS